MHDNADFPWNSGCTEDLHYCNLQDGCQRQLKLAWCGKTYIYIIKTQQLFYPPSYSFVAHLVLLTACMHFDNQLANSNRLME